MRTRRDVVGALEKGRRRKYGSEGGREQRRRERAGEVEGGFWVVGGRVGGVVWCGRWREDAKTNCTHQ